MIRSQKPSIRPSVYSQSTSNETNVSDIHSYVGKILILNHHQILVEDILGQGGFAFVFRVRTYNHQRYALKRMYVNNQRDLDICQREISLLKEFSSHRNIIKYVDHSINRISKQYSEEDTIYEVLLLTEYCLNGSLITRLDQQRHMGVTLNERQILRIFADLCNAVSACHYRRPQPVLHRDIKLENILIDSQQNYLLCDFGSAIFLSHSSSTNNYQQYSSEQLTTKVIQELEEEIQRYTTLSYRAPELIDLYSRIPITLKVDIWAMGCLLYKLMYNTMPFGDSILAIQNGTFVLPDDLSNEYSRELNLFLRYILEIDITKRPDIWQISYLTYKLLGSECPISNRCQSKIPDLKLINMPLTESEYKHQRTTTLAKSKSTSANLVDESATLGTAVNPRERPRGIIAPSTSLINFNQRSPATLAVPSPSTTTTTTTAQLMFDDDFSLIPTHAISLTNIPTGTAVNVRPPASSLGSQQQQLLPPLPYVSSNTNLHGHRRSSSQTITSTTHHQSSFQDGSFIDFSNPSKDEIKKPNSSSLISISDDEQKPNPFLHAPFHMRQTSANTIMTGKQSSAFTTYQKEASNGNVFTNAPFSSKSKSKQPTGIEEFF